MEPILREFPSSFDTERLTIRCPQPGDGAELHVATMESMDRLRPWFPWADPQRTVEDAEALLRQAQVRFLAREDLWLLLMLKGTSTLVGSSGLHGIDWSVPRFEIGYWVRTRYERQGYITEAVLGITDFAVNTLGTKRLTIRCDTTNQRSAAVARRAGFEHEGTLRHVRRHHLTDELVDEMIFALVKD